MPHDPVLTRGQLQSVLRVNIVVLVLDLALIQFKSRQERHVSRLLQPNGVARVSVDVISPLVLASALDLY